MYIYILYHQVKDSLKHWYCCESVVVVVVVCPEGGKREKEQGAQQKLLNKPPEKSKWDQRPRGPQQATSSRIYRDKEKYNEPAGRI